MKTLLYTLAQRVFIGALIFTHCHLMATTYTLTLFTNGSGTVTPNPNLAAYPASSTVTVTATAGSGYFFSNYTGTVFGTSNVINVTMTSNQTLIAHFAVLPALTLTTTNIGSGTLSLSPSGGHYASNTVVQATATPASNWLFLNWSGAVFSTNNPISITMTSNSSLAANYVEPPVVDAAPQNVTTNVGADLDFTVSAEASPAPAYQWYFLNAPLSGETNFALALTNIQTTQAGLYAVTVSNAYGMTSNTATLTLTNLPAGANAVGNLTEDALAAAINIGGVVSFASNGIFSFSYPITVTNNVVLDGTGRVITLNGNNATRLFNISPGVTFSATNISFVNGQVIGSPATSSLSGSGSNACGGAFNIDSANLSLTDCSLLSNSVIGGQGETNTQLDYTYASGGAAMGGAIYVTGGNVTLRGTTLASNIAFSPFGLTNTEGGAICAISSSVSLFDCVASNNLATNNYGPIASNLPIVWGGAIFATGSTLVCSNSMFTLNKARGGDSPNSSGVPVEQASWSFGGAIATLGPVTITQSTFSSNTAYAGEGYRSSHPGEAEGGALYATSNFSITGSCFMSNQACAPGYFVPATPAQGGAIYVTGLGGISSSVICSNLAWCNPDFAPVGTGGYPSSPSYGGGIYNAGTLALTNCTIAYNTAQGGGAQDVYSPPAGSFGGGIYNTNGTVTGYFLTIASNTVAEGTTRSQSTNYSGAQIANSNGIVYLKDSIIAYSGTGTNAFGPIVDGGYNISSDGTANFASGTSFNYTDPLLGPLTNNGGNTLTMTLSISSPAVDFGTAVVGVITDQRGFARPVGSGYDIGAFELGSSAPPLSLTAVLNGTNMSIIFFGVASNTYVLQATPTLAAPIWSPVATNVVTNSGMMSIPVSTSPNSAQFYRLHIP